MNVFFEQLKKLWKHKFITKTNRKNNTLQYFYFMIKGGGNTELAATIFSLTRLYRIIKEQIPAI